MTAPANPAGLVYSMTGFARIAGRIVEAGAETASWAVSIKSVNHRFLDLHLRLPGGSDKLEMELRRRLKDRVRRGHLELTLTADRISANRSDGPSYNRDLVAQYVAAFQAAAREQGIAQQPDLNAAFRLPGVFGTPVSNAATAESREQRDAGLEALQNAVLDALNDLLDQLDTMRIAEGKALASILHACLGQLSRDVDTAATLRAGVQNAYLVRLRERMQSLVGAAVDESRLLQEAAVLADRSDVEEEIARLRVHIEHFRTLLDAGGEVGKKLDFLLQEMNREANTLLAKSAGIPEQGARITELGLNMKSVIEKIREQVQNLE